MTTTATAHPALEVDAPAELERIAKFLETALGSMRRRGVVLGISGGIDSSVVAGVCAKLLGPKRVFGIFMPERDSDPESLRLGRLLAAHLGIETALEDIAPSLEAAGCYQRRDDAIRQAIPEYGEGWKSKIVVTGGQSAAYNLFAVVAQEPSGKMRRVRLPYSAYLGIVAATNMKQRTRKQLEYYHADRLNFAVAGTPNKLEYDLGFFVKNGDGAADFKPIAHLYKSQVYALAAYLGLPPDIQARQPTTDTYSLGQTQEEFYFAVPYRQMDICLYSLDHGIPAAEAGAAAGLTAEHAQRVYEDIQAKRRVAEYLHHPPLLINGH